MLTNKQKEKLNKKIQKYKSILKVSCKFLNAKAFKMIMKQKHPELSEDDIAYLYIKLTTIE